MKSLFALSCTCFFLITSPCPAHADDTTQAPTTEIAPQEPTIHWFMSLEQAKQANVNSNLPYYICFTGPEWCFWCQRLEKEIQSQPDFIQRIHDKFIFVQVNIPKDSSQADPVLREFMLKWKVYGVPVILILSPELKELGRLSYQKIAPKDFADLSLQIRDATLGTEKK